MSTDGQVLELSFINRSSISYRRNANEKVSRSGQGWRAVGLHCQPDSESIRYTLKGWSCRGSHNGYDAEFTHKTPTLEHSDISQVVNGLCLPQNIFQMVSHKFIILSYGECGMYLGLSCQTTKVLG